MAVVFAAMMRLIAGFVGLIVGLLGLFLGGAGTVLGVGFAGLVILLVLLGILLSPWLFLGLMVWAAWRLLGGGRYRRGTWYVVR